MATLLHPAYWTNNASRHIEIDYDPATSERRVVMSRLVKDYLHVPPAKGIAIPGQPAAQVMGKALAVAALDDDLMRTRRAVEALGRDLREGRRA